MGIFHRFVEDDGERLTEEEIGHQDRYVVAPPGVDRRSAAPCGGAVDHIVVGRADDRVGFADLTVLLASWGPCI